MIIFDMDGTLWNTVDTTLEAANIIANKYDEVKEFTIDTIEKGMGLSTKENAANYMPYLDEEKAIYYLKKITEENLKIINDKGAHIYDGVIETIKTLSKKYKLGIVTNSNDDYAKLFLKVSNLDDYFTDYMGAASYNITKGEAIKLMCKNNNEPNSFYVGDIKKDMIATNEAGITFIHAKYGFEPDLKTKYYINDIKELDKLITDIKRK